VSAAGTANCGTTGSESCCASVEVIGAPSLGTYYRTYTNTGTGPTGEMDPATVSNLRIDKYNVTVGRFRQFVAAWNGGYTPPGGSGIHTHLNGGLGLANVGAGGGFETGWVTTNNSNIAPTSANFVAACSQYSTWTNTPGTQETLPINCVNWWESYAFCIWDGGFLPSEAEWEYAAAGGSQQLEYPWGSPASSSTTDPGTTNQFAIYGCFFPLGSDGNCTGAANIAPVGSSPSGAGVWSQLDLAGDVAQWTLDADTGGGYVDPCTDCALLSAIASSNRIFRGGDFHDGVSFMDPPARLSFPPVSRNDAIGFRCARTP